MYDVGDCLYVWLLTMSMKQIETPLNTTQRKVTQFQCSNVSSLTHLVVDETPLLEEGVHAQDGAHVAGCERKGKNEMVNVKIMNLADFSYSLVSHYKQISYPGCDGKLWR